MIIIICFSFAGFQMEMSIKYLNVSSFETRQCQRHSVIRESAPLNCLSTAANRGFTGVFLISLAERRGGGRKIGSDLKFTIAEILVCVFSHWNLLLKNGDGGGIPVTESHGRASAVVRAPRHYWSQATALPKCKCGYNLE